MIEMARMRTPEEREAIALECIKLEQEGGDILAYLWSQDYVTPRATWCNIQRQYLNRKPYEYTDGKPKKTGRKYKPMPRKGDMKAIAVAVAEEIEAGRDYKLYMEGLGYKEPQAALAYFRKQLKKTDPELVERLYVRKPNTYIHDDMTLPAGVVHKPMTDEEIEELTRPYRPEEKDVLTFGEFEPIDGKELKESNGEEFYGRAGKVFDGMIRKGLGLPAEEPELTPVAFDGLVGRWDKEGKDRVTFYKVETDPIELMSMTLTVKEWLAICAEIPSVIVKMGMQEAARED